MPTTATALCRSSSVALLTLLLLSRQTVAPRPLAARRRAAQPPHLGRADRLAAIAKGAPDVAAYLPLRFEAKFSSPCWRNGSALRCLPRLFLAGAMQCGVPALWERLRAHALLGAQPLLVLHRAHELAELLQLDVAVAARLDALKPMVAHEALVRF
mgnify:CR=1 FL=1